MDEKKRFIEERSVVERGTRSHSLLNILRPIEFEENQMEYPVNAPDSIKNGSKNHYNLYYLQNIQYKLRISDEWKTLVSENNEILTEAEL